MSVRNFLQQPFKLPKGITVPGELQIIHDHVSHIPGEAAAIRFFVPSSSDDLEAMRKILKGKQVKRWMDDTKQISRSQYHDWAGTKTNHSFLFAALNTRVSHTKMVKDARGFVYIYSEFEEKFRVRRMEKHGFLTPTKNERYALEISFAARPLRGGKQKGSGIMSSAVRQSCFQVQKLLYVSNKPEVIIFGFVDPDNLGARRTLEASGFVKKGKMKYDSNSPQESLLYVLSWRLLQRKIKAKVLAALGPEGKGV